MPKDLRVNSDRMLVSFNELALIGATDDGGVNRPTFSEAHLAAQIGFVTKSNALAWSSELMARGITQPGCPTLRAAKPQSNLQQSWGLPRRALLSAMAKTLLIGSHLDSVPSGGRFDGALGVVAALEVLRTVKENGIRLNVNLEAIDFTDEEGTLVSFLRERGDIRSSQSTRCPYPARRA